MRHARISSAGYLLLLTYLNRDHIFRVREGHWFEHSKAIKRSDNCGLPYDHRERVFEYDVVRDRVFEHEAVTFAYVVLEYTGFHF